MLIQAVLNSRSQISVRNVVEALEQSVSKEQLGDDATIIRTKKESNMFVSQEISGLFHFLRRGRTEQLRLGGIEVRGTSYATAHDA